MHPLPAAHATVASLHALLLGHDPSSSDEQVVFDAISALRQWGLPDRRPVPTRLRLRRSLPLQVRVKIPCSEATLTKRGKRRNLRPRRARRSANAELSLSQGAQHSAAGKPSAAKHNVGEGASQPPSLSLSSTGSQAVNFSDLSTEPPEGWPRLTDLSSPTLENGTAVLKSQKDLDKEGRMSATNVVAQEQKERNDARSEVINRQCPGAGSRAKSPQSGIIAVSAAKRVAKRRRRASPVTSHGVEDTELVKPDRGAFSASQGSTGGADSHPHSPGTREPGRKCAQRVSVRKKRANKRKSSVPKRRRSTTPHESLEPPFTSDGENEALGQTASATESPPQGFDDNSSCPARSAKAAQCGRNTESPPTSVTQKSREQDTDSHSHKSNEPAHSLGSVVVGSASDDGRSVDFGYGLAAPKRDDGSSRPSPVVWNESNAESIEEPLTGDQSGFPIDTIEETEKIPTSGLPESAKESHHPDSFPGRGISNPTAQVVNKGCPAIESSLRDDDITSTRLHNGSGRPLTRKESKNSSTTPSLPHPEKNVDPSNLRVVSSTPYGRNAPDLDRKSRSHQLPDRISSVSLAEPPADGEKYVETCRKARPICPPETSIGEMVICIASFTKEIESELAHELVIRLGGEIVSDFESTQPECVVAPVDPQAKEVLSWEMILLFALASRVPIVGLSWLTQCFKSGCWVDSKDFETPSSRLNRLKSSSGVFRGVAASFEDAFSRKNSQKQCREYRDGISKLIVLAGGLVVDNSQIVGVTQSDKRIRLHIQIAYDFGNDCLNTAQQEVSDLRIPMHVVNKSWVSACLISGQCPPP